MGDVDLEAVRRAHFKLVLDYAFGTANFVMPNVLAKLNAGSAFVVNPQMSTPGILGFDRDIACGPFGRACPKASGAHLGVLIAPDGEQLTIVDDTGRVLSDDQALLAFTVLISKEHQERTHSGAGQRLVAGQREFAPVVSMMLKSFGPNSRHPILMEIATSTHAHFASDVNGAAISFPAVPPRILMPLSALGPSPRPASWSRVGGCPEIIDSLPSVCVVHKTVPTRFGAEGGIDALDCQQSSR